MRLTKQDIFVLTQAKKHLIETLTQIASNPAPMNFDSACRYLDEMLTLCDEESRIILSHVDEIKSECMLKGTTTEEISNQFKNEIQACVFDARVASLTKLIEDKEPRITSYGLAYHVVRYPNTLWSQVTKDFIITFNDGEKIKWSAYSTPNKIAEVHLAFNIKMAALAEQLKPSTPTLN